MGDAAAVEFGQAQLQPGLVVAEKYRLEAKLGEGAMGSVWSAKHMTLGHMVAIKFLNGSVQAGSEPRARFEREARLAARLGEASRHITRVTDHGLTAEGCPFLVMELLHGEGLDARLKRERRLPMLHVAKITSQLCRALAVAHGAGVIHRDLKPANVFLTTSEDDNGLFVKLLDFGVAKATLETDDNQATRAGALIGTPNYMSPEQIVGDSSVDARSDLWAIAAIVYRMAVGKPPFGSGALSELAMRIVSTDPPQATALAPDLPPEFDLWVRKGLAKKAEARFQNARDLSDSLAMVAGISSSGSTGAFSAAAAERLALQLADSTGGVQHTLADQRLAPPVLEAPQKKGRGLTYALIAMAALAGVASGVAVYLVRASKDSGGVPASGKTEPKAAASATTEVTTKSSATAEPTSTATASTSVASAAPTAKPTYPMGPGKKLAGAPTGKPADAAPSAAPPPTAAPTATVDIDKKSGDLWKKKDEM